MITVKENTELAPHTTFEIGGAGRFFADVKDESEIREAIEWARDKAMPFTVISGGSNVLIPDGGLSGLVIRIIEGEHSFNCETLRADAGCNLLGLIEIAGKKGLGGWEKMSGIPGSIGGAARGNAGAFGTEMKDVVSRVQALNSKTGELREFANDECDFSYRHSFFKDIPDWIITRVSVDLKPIDPEESAKLSRETIAEREKRHLQNVKAAGSFFMNPVAPKEIVEMFEKEKGVKSREGRVPAGWLIEKAGMKGAMVGAAKASEQHPNYIVNTGGATAHDVRNLAQKIMLEVYEKFGVELQPEAALL